MPDAKTIEIKYTTNVIYLNHPKTISYSPGCGKIVFHKTNLWCPKRLGTTGSAPVVLDLMCPSEAESVVKHSGDSQP